MGVYEDWFDFWDSPKWLLEEMQLAFVTGFTLQPWELLFAHICHKSVK